LNTFTELHARSAFSFLRGASQPDDIVTRAAELGMDAVAIVDRDGVYGSARAQRAAKAHGIRAIVGSEITMEDGSALPLLVRTRTGYQNLCRLLTRAHLRAAKNESAVLWDELEEFAPGLICLTGDSHGPLHRHFAAKKQALASSTVDRLLGIFGKGNLYVELIRRNLRSDKWLEQQHIGIAQKFGLPLVASNAPEYARTDARSLCDAFTCLRHHTTLDDAGPLLAPNSQAFLKSPQQMRETFAHLPDALTNTQRIAEEIDFTLENLGYQFPNYAVPAGDSMHAMLRREAYAGARGRYGKITPKIRKQLDHELSIIGKLHFEGYFLIVWGIVNFARSTGILVQGRGSAANSAVCYSLGITACDPIGGGLLFERFLSEGREGWPDIDLDLPSGDRRESVIQEVYRRYAPHGAAMTANVITYRSKSAMREMGKVLGFPQDYLSRFSELFGHGDFPHDVELKSQLKMAGLPDEHPRLTSLLKLYRQVIGMPRHLGQHSGGMVICDTGLNSVVPLENASMPGRVVIQWDKEDCEDMGIVKVDLLGLGMMAAMQDTLQMCKQRGPAREFDLAKLPMDDPATFEMMQKADTIGVFQIESRAQMATLPRMKPKVFYDVAVEVALIRPGPIVGDLVHPYLNRRNGKEKIDYIHPLFEPILKRTLGVPLFQEQVLRMAMVIADFTGSEAEELRKSMSFHRSEERMQRVLGKLRTAMAQREVAPHIQDKICDSICSFALYGFPESHAISFGMLAYASVWMKAHRPVEFYTALLNNQPMGFYSPATLIKDAKDHGIRIRPVSVIDSDVPCTVESDNALRLGLTMVKGLNKEHAQIIITDRQKNGLWENLESLLTRIPLTKEERRALAKIGAFNGLPQATHRREALWNAEHILPADDLFSNVVWASCPHSPAPLQKMNAIERLQSDYDTLHLTTGPHPVALIRDQLRAQNIWPAKTLTSAPNNQQLSVAGLVICRQRPGTAKGHLFISLEDETGITNAFVPAPTFQKYRLVITQEPFLILHGRLQNIDNVISIYTTHIQALKYETLLHTKSHDFH
jgi:error-prone DNA polymerase